MGGEPNTTLTNTTRRRLAVEANGINRLPAQRDGFTRRAVTLHRNLSAPWSGRLRPIRFNFLKRWEYCGESIGFFTSGNGRNGAEETAG